MRRRQLRGRQSAARATRRRARGAVLLEATACVQLLALLAFGIVDLGFAYRDYLSQVGAAKSGARVIANAGKKGNADYLGIVALRSALSTLPTAQVDRVVVYKADANGDPNDARCLQKGAWESDHGILGECNIYSGSEVLTAASTSFTSASATSCSLGLSLDARWCPVSRLAPSSSFVTGDSVGVFIEIRYQSRTRLFNYTQIVMKDRFVMRVEPEVL